MMGKKEMKPNRNRLIFVCLKWLFLFSMTLLLVIAAVYASVTSWLSQMLYRPTLSDFLQYEEMIFRDNYQEIPMGRFQDCQFVVLDRDGEVIYQSNSDVRSHFSSVELQCIEDYNTNSYLAISRLKGKKGQYDGYYIITERNFENGYETVSAYCVLDEEYNIIEGNLFSGVDSLTETEINFIHGIYSKKYFVSKYTYQNVKGEDRTLIFYSPRTTLRALGAAVDNGYRVWFFFIPAFLIVLAVFGLFIGHQVKRYLRPLNAAILGMPQKQQIDLENYTGPREFAEIVQNFNLMAEKLEETEKQKEKLEEDRRRMLMDISHDLKNPITVIQGYAKAIHDGIVPAETVPQYIELICRKAADVSSLTNSFFEYCSMTHPDFRVEPIPCDLCEYLKEYLGEKYEELEMAGCDLTVEFPEQEILCSIDPKMFRRIMENLLNNSMRYNPDGTEIFCGLEVWDGQAVLTVGDHGVGIPPEIQDTLFDPFVVGDSSRGKKQGHGLGMSIVKKVVEAHGGSVHLAKDRTHGLSVEFRIFLPLADSSLSEN